MAAPSEQQRRPIEEFATGLLKESREVYNAVAWARDIAASVGQAPVGLNHLVLGLSINPEVSAVMKEYGWDLRRGMEELQRPKLIVRQKQQTFMDRLRRRPPQSVIDIVPVPQGTTPVPSAELQSILERAVLNKLMFGHGMETDPNSLFVGGPKGEVTAFNLLHTVLNSDETGLKMARYKDEGPHNDGRRLLRAAGVNMEGLVRRVDQRLQLQMQLKV